MNDDMENVRWFGESWGAPVCEPAAHIATPLGRACYGHNHMHKGRSSVIEADDRGVTVPFYSTAGVLTIAYHLDCWLHEVGADRA